MSMLHGFAVCAVLFLLYANHICAIFARMMCMLSDILLMKMKFPYIMMIRVFDSGNYWSFLPILLTFGDSMMMYYGTLAHHVICMYPRTHTQVTSLMVCLPSMMINLMLNRPEEVIFYFVVGASLLGYRYLSSGAISDASINSENETTNESVSEGDSMNVSANLSEMLDESLSDCMVVKTSDDSLTTSPITTDSNTVLVSKRNVLWSDGVHDVTVTSISDRRVRLCHDLEQPNGSSELSDTGDEMEVSWTAGPLMEDKINQVVRDISFRDPLTADDVLSKYPMVLEQFIRDIYDV